VVSDGGEAADDNEDAVDIQDVKGDEEILEETDTESQDKTEEDIPAYNALVLDGERNRWWGYDDVGGLGGPVEERSFYEVAQADFASKLAVNFAVRLDGKLIGEAVLYHFDCRGSAELGCRIDAAYAGNGYGTEAFTAVANWGLYKIQLSRIVAKCFKENEASYKMLSSCMRKCGDDETFFYFEKLV
jgi:RimJ/RimL family protein N-acetyltransferase